MGCSSAQAKKRKNRHDHDDQANEIDDAIHGAAPWAALWNPPRVAAPMNRRVMEWFRRAIQDARNFLSCPPSTGVCGGALDSNGSGAIHALNSKGRRD